MSESTAAAPPAPPEPSQEEIEESLRIVKKNVEEAVKSPEGMKQGRLLEPVIIAVSKTKSAACVQRAYDVGHRVFGENYVHEVVAKAPVLPPDVDWHFIGHLQSNKAKELIQAAPNLVCLHTLDSVKLAQLLNKEVGKVIASGARAASRGPLEVLLQINTSGEESKSGLDPEPLEAILEVTRFVVGDCPHLRFAGFMTIGMPDYTSTPINFQRLAAVRAAVAAGMAVGGGSDAAVAERLHLSMGMSGDYIQAVSMGATMVRVGSTIFGMRAPKVAAAAAPADTASAPA